MDHVDFGIDTTFENCRVYFSISLEYIEKTSVAFLDETNHKSGNAMDYTNMLTFFTTQVK